MRRLGLTTIVGVLAFASLPAAQLKVDVALVHVVATVTDEHGRYVADLGPEDFVLQEDGQTQTIAHLTQSLDIPVSMGIVLDTSGSMQRKISTATEAVERFINSIHKEDVIFLMTFSDTPNLRQDFTNSRSILGAALRRVRVGGGTALYDAMNDSVRKVKDGVHKKRAILLVSDGQDTTSATELHEAESAVRESEVLVYAMGISPSADNRPMTERLPIPTGGPQIPTGGPTSRMPFPLPIPIPGGPGGSGRTDPRMPAPDPRVPPRTSGPLEDTVDMRILNRISEASGAKAFLIARMDQIDEPLDEIAAELRNQYSIGYYPQHALKDGKWHRIEIRAKDRRYNVRAKKDYFGG